MESDPGTASSGPSRGGLFAYCLVWGFIAYLATTGAVLIAVALNFHVLVPRSDMPHSEKSLFSSFVRSMARVDGRSFVEIVENGYHFQPGSPSNAAFFPVAPLAALPLTRLGIGADAALVLVSNVSFALCLAVLYGGYALPGAKQPALAGNGDESLTPWLVGLWPLSFFFRAAYSEAVFVLFAAATLVAIRRRASIWLVAIVAGAATATRPVGVAVLPACLWYFACKWRDKETSLPAAGAALALSVWGIAAYSVYLGLAFGEPLAFFKTQAEWAVRGDAPVSEWLWATVTLQPIWEKFDPSSPFHWRMGPGGRIPLFNTYFLGSFVVLGTVALVIDGARRKWISWPDLLFAITVIAIPYVLHGYKNAMLSQGRYMMACLPAFAIIARHLSRAPPGFQVAYFAISTALLVAYTALFSAGYLF